MSLCLCAWLRYVYLLSLSVYLHDFNMLLQACKHPGNWILNALQGIKCTDKFSVMIINTNFKKNRCLDFGSLYLQRIRLA